MMKIYEALIRELVNLNIRISFYGGGGGLKIKWLTSYPNIQSYPNLIKKWLDWKLTSEPLIYFDVRVI